MMSTRRVVGFALLGGFLACVVLANYFIVHVGDQAAPGAPHTVTAFGLGTAPSGVVWVGVAFSLRDLAQQALGRWWVLAAIACGAVLSYLVAPSLAVASGTAFAVSETADWLCWTPLADRGRYLSGLVLSNTVGSALDTLVFLWLAFHSLAFFRGQFVWKLAMTLPFAVGLIIVRSTRARRIA